MSAATFTLEQDAQGRFVLQPQDSAQEDGCGLTIARYGVAPAVSGAIIAASLGVSAAGLAAFDPQMHREWFSIGAQAGLSPKATNSPNSSMV